MQVTAILTMLMATITSLTEHAIKMGGNIDDIKIAVNKGLARSEVPDAVREAESYLPEN